MRTHKPAITGWLLPEDERERLLRLFPPRYPDVVAHHVTHRYDVSPDEPPPGASDGEIVGRADDGAGVEALVVRMNGSGVRPDGGTYHVTWSLDRGRGRRSAESNEVIAAGKWERIAVPIPIRLRPARFD